MLKEDETNSEVINKSKINLNFTKNYEGKPSFKARVFEIGACKSFLLTEYFEGYKEFLKEGKELIMFKNKQDLLDKVKYYLRNESEREKIASLAYKKIINNYSQDVEFLRIFKEIDNKKQRPNKNILINSNKILSELDENDMKLKFDEIKNKISRANYVAFKNKKSVFLPHKNSIQIYGLEKTNKDISLCDYYVNSRLVGDYLSVYSGYAYKNLDRASFLKITNISQFLVKKDFFLKNFEKFKLFYFGKKEDIINENNTSFVYFPLVSIKDSEFLDYIKMNKITIPKFENNLRKLSNEKRLLSSSYIYKIILASTISNKFVLKYMWDRIHNKNIRSKVFSLT